MSEIVEKVLDKLQSGEDGIYSYSFSNTSQEDEILLRKKVARNKYDNHLDIIAQHHSIPVMDREVSRFLKSIPEYGVIIDAGGGWAWHWRHLSDIRPDVKVFVVDFVKENLYHANSILGPAEHNQVSLVHGDATDLVFDDNTFDGYWSVQTLQHTPNFSKAVQEAFRVLKPGGVFANYSFNVQKPIQILYKVFRLPYHIEGHVHGKYYLARASEKQRRIIETTFCNLVESRFTELIFSPELGLPFGGRENSLIGKLDSFLSGTLPFARLVARQQSFHTIKQ